MAVTEHPSAILADLFNAAVYERLSVTVRDEFSEYSFVSSCFLRC